ncbi:hypothetical protein LPMP_040210 [Leishmania panamensis]|uniref:GRAM domain-containing protein n=1 Tax=Leishmania panamensis TaxID=5679 RepID=A0A088RHI5_LEIPA|nr:hypothetical protein LPMP_040210 [Leishmania panamensis]AIN95348.1 hypothetical protein LPMP_040210 [Leishmania panamensis]
MQQQQRQPVEHYAYVELISLTYSGPAPAPAPACTDPTPDEQLRQAITHKKEMLRQKEAQQRQQVAHGAGQAHNPTSGTASGGGSFTKHLSVSAGEIFSNIKSSVSHAVLSLEKGATNVSTRTEEQMRQYEYQHDLDRFRLHFWELVEQGELLLGAYRCSAMHGGVQVNGHIQITRHYLCFFADTSSTITKTTDAVRDALASVRQPAGANPEGRHRPVGIKLVTPLVEIASIQPSVAHKTIDGQAPFFTLLPAATVCATALQVYTADKKLHQFLNFESLMSRASGALSELKASPLDQTFNYLDHAWRELVTVPLKGVEYA